MRSITAFSLSQRARCALYCSSMSARRFSISWRRFLESASDSFSSTFFSIVSWVIFSFIAISSTGMLSSSSFKREAASSTKSMALSGRKRDVM